MDIEYNPEIDSESEKEENKMNLQFLISETAFKLEERLKKYCKKEGLTLCENCDDLNFEKFIKFVLKNK